MPANSASDSSQESDSSTARSTVIVLIIIAACVMIFFDIITGLFSHGGLFSFFSALGAIQRRVASIEVDGRSFQTPTVVAISLLCIAACAPIKEIWLSKKVATIVVMLVIIVGGMILDATVGRFLVSRFMAAHGYSRCPAGDIVVGNGKSRIWFDDYVAPHVACVSQREMITSPSN